MAGEGLGTAGLPGGLPAGSRIAGYRLEEQIGQGGMAVVFRARDVRLERQVALKVLAPGLAADEGFRRRFIRESRAAAAVDHPHIVPVFEAGEADGVLFLAMRYVPGGDIGTLVRRAGPLPGPRAAAVIAAVASALDAAHAAGLVHRDVKPGNVLVDGRPGQPDHVYLSDFGLTRGTLPSAALTGTGQFLGTLDYCAPEQIQGGTVDGRTDEYALACAVFELLSGLPPFPRDEAMAVLYAQLSEPPPSLAQRRPGLPPPVDGVLRRALAKSPGDRYASCGEFAAALGSALGLGLGLLQPAPGYRPGPAMDYPATVGSGPTADTIGPWASGAPAGPARTRPRLGVLAVAGAGIAALAAGGAVAAMVLTSNTGNASDHPVNPGITRPASSAVGLAPAASSAGTATASSPGTTAPEGISDPSSGIWIAQLASVPISAGQAQLQQELDQIQTEIPGAQYLDSSNYASLNPGYWVVYYAGSFGDGNQALRYCAAHGRTTRNECVGRFLSTDIRDKSYICLPPADSQATGCVRSATSAFRSRSGRPDRPALEPGAV